MEFVFDSEIKPKQENFLSIDDLEKNLFKKVKDINGSNKYYRDIYSGLDDIIEKNCGLPEEIVEKYRVEWNSKYSNYHRGYLWYLYSAFMSDAGIEIAPWYLYNIIFHQIAQVIKENVEEYRNIFTPSEEKITIKMYTIEFDINTYTEYIKQLIPDSKTFDTFFPSWSNPPPYYNECIGGLFADMVQKYYDSVIIGCSCPKVRVLGNQKDWDNLYLSIVRIKEIFNSNNSHTLDKYLSRVITCLENFKYNWTKAETWEYFFFVSNCGSGSDKCIEGIIRELLDYDLDDDYILVHQMPDTLSRFPFEMAVYGMEKQKESYYISGMIGSNLDADGYLVPKYDYSITWIDKELTQFDENKLNELKWVREELEKWDRISIGGKHIKHHFNHNCSQYSSTLDYEEFITNEEIKIINLNDNEVLDKHLEKLLKNKMRSYLNLKEFQSIGLFEIEEEPTLFSITQEFEQKRKRGTKKQYAEQVEKERIEKITNNPLYSHLWFEGINCIEPSIMSWLSNKKALLNLSQYLKQVSKVNEYILEFTNPEYMKKFIGKIKYLNAMLETQYNPSDIIYGTLNPQIIKLYCELFPSESEYIIKILLDKISESVNLKFNFSEMVELSHFTLDDDLVQYLTKIYSIQLNEPFNKQINLTIKKLEKEAEELNNCKENLKKYNVVERFKKIHENILKLIELKTKINSNITNNDKIVSNCDTYTNTITNKSNELEC